MSQESGRSLRGLFEKVRVNSFFFGGGISGFWVGLSASNFYGAQKATDVRKKDVWDRRFPRHFLKCDYRSPQNLESLRPKSVISLRSTIASERGGGEFLCDENQAKLLPTAEIPCDTPSAVKNR